MDAVIYLRVSTKEQTAKDETGEATPSPPSGRRAFATSPSEGGTWRASSSTLVSPQGPRIAQC